MDRNGKKAKADRGSLHAERSDTKATARATLGMGGSDARLAAAAGKGAPAGSASKPARKGHRA